MSGINRDHLPTVVLVDSKTAAYLSGYSVRYVQMLCKEKRVFSYKVNGIWFVKKSDIINHREGIRNALK